MRKKLVKAFLIIVLASTSSGVLGADFRALIEVREKGIVNWTDGVVEAKGSAFPATYTYDRQPQLLRQETISEALIKAQHNLLETIVGLRINSQSRVIDIVENYPSFMTQLKDMARNTPEMKARRKHHYDGSVEVCSQLNLNGGFYQLILPPEIRQIEPIQQVLSRSGPTNSKARLRSSNIFTGLVVDARGLRAVPVLAPRILDENMEEVFGPTYASREFAVQRGIARYTMGMSKAKYNLRVSDNPLVVRALKTIWPARCDFIISNADAAKLRSASEHLEFLKGCRVIIVLDRLTDVR